MTVLFADFIVNIFLIESLRANDGDLYIELKKPSGIFNLNIFKLFNFSYFFIIPKRYEKYNISDKSKKLFKIRKLLIILVTLLFVFWFPVVYFF